MAEDLRVNPTDVRMGADHVDTHTLDLLSRHTSAHERIAAAQSGWIGAAAAALAERVAHWEAESAAHCAELYGHGEDLRRAAASYESSDTGAASNIDNVSSGLVDRMGL